MLVLQVTFYHFYEHNFFYTLQYFMLWYNTLHSSKYWIVHRNSSACRHTQTHHTPCVSEHTSAGVWIASLVCQWVATQSTWLSVDVQTLHLHSIAHCQTLYPIATNQSPVTVAHRSLLVYTHQVCIKWNNGKQSNHSNSNNWFNCLAHYPNNRL